MGKLRRVFIFTLVLMLVFGLTACVGGGSTPSDADTEKPTSKPTQSTGKDDADPTTPPDSGDDDEEKDDKTPSESQTKAKDIIGDREGWTFSRLGGECARFWDSEVLPDCFPDNPGNVDMEDWYTSFKAVGDEETWSNNVGELEYSDSYFNKWVVCFECGQAEVDNILAQMDAKGYIMYADEGEDDSFYEYYNGQYYIYIRVSKNYFDTTNEYQVDINATDTINKVRMETFDGTPLPTFGINTYLDSYYYFAYDDENNEIECTYDPATDTGSLFDAKSYMFYINYYMVSKEQWIAYCDELTAAGWVVDSFETDDEYGSCYYRARKGDDKYIMINYTSSDVVIVLGNTEYIYY